MPDISPQDLDMATRTVLSEAGDNSDAGQAAVANVIRNRLASGRWGDSPTSVVMARGQFEPWSLSRNDPNHPLRHDPKSPEYQHTAEIVRQVFSGNVPDITQGSTHFYDPQAQAALRRKVPDWARGDGIAIGSHRFYAPEGRVEGSASQGSSIDPMAAIDAAIGARPAQGGAGTQPAPPGGLFRAAGFDVPAASQAAPAPSAAVPGGATAKPGSMFEAAGFTLPAGKATVPAPAQLGPDAPGGAAGVIDVPGGGRHYIDAKGNFLDTPGALAPSYWQQVQDRARASTRSGDIREGMVNAFNPAAAMAKQGWQGIFGGRPASGLGQVALGGLGMVASPVTGAVNALVEKPVTELTGNPEVGQRAGFVAGLVPGAAGMRAGAAVASNVLPSSKAINALVEAVGPENALAAVDRLRANPRLTWADVSDPVRIRAQGLIDPAQPKAMEAITGAVKQRVAEGPGEVNYAYTSTMGPAPDVVKMVEGLKERARAAGREQIQPALAKAKPVDTSPVIKAIDDIVKPGLTAMLDPGTRLPLSPLQQELLRVKQQLVAPTGETLVDAQRLHDVQSRLGDYAYQLQGGSPKDRLLGSGLRDINEKLIDQIDAATGGAYRPARAAFKDAKDIHQAFDEGFDVLKNRAGVKGLEDRPEALAEWMKTATPEEVVAKRLGVRSDIDQKIRGVKNQVLAGTNITKIEYNRDKLTTLFGEKEASRLIRSMDDAADIAKTNAKLVEGSKTAETLAGQKAMEVREIGGGNPLQYVTPVAAELLGQGAGLPGVGMAGVLALTGAHRGAQKIGQLSDLARNAAFARNALATGPAREETIRRVLSHPKVVRALQKPGNALATTGAP